MAARIGRSVLTCAAFVGAAAVIPLAAFHPQSTEQIASEAKRSTPGGATFTAPPGWSLRNEGNTVVLTPPETDSHLAIVEVKASDAPSAVAPAWPADRPGFKRRFKLMTPRSGRGGWHDRKNFDYETSPN